MKFFFKPIAWISFLFLFACGGGGSSSDPEIINPIIPPSPNDLPECNPSGYEKTLYCTYTRLGLDREFYVYVPDGIYSCLLYTSPSPRDMRRSRMPSSA